MSKLYCHLAYIGLRTGAYEASLKACRKALEFGEKSTDASNAIKLALHLKGLCQLATGESPAALKTAEELKDLAEREQNPRALKHFHHLTGSIEVEVGNTGNAITHFEAAAPLLPSQNQDDLIGFKESLRRTIFLASLADAYFRSGNMDKAKQTYEILAGLTIGRHYWADLYVKAFYRLGQISEKQGKRDEAAVHYQKFLDLWKDADPGISDLSDARTRLDLIMD